MPRFDPLAQRMYLLLSLSEAQNECEIVACETALRVLERTAPGIRSVCHTEERAADE